MQTTKLPPEHVHGKPPDRPGHPHASKASAKALPPGAMSALHEALRRHGRGAKPWELFDRRVQTHHEATGMRLGTPLPPPAASANLAQALEKPLPHRPRAIYLHVPFCQSICSFCAFFRRGNEAAGSINTYSQALSRDVKQLSEYAWASAAPIDAVYFGGGTPTVLSAPVLASLVVLLRERYFISEKCEITVESRCNDADERSLATLRKAGVNRISFGVQSFDTTVRQDVGRICDQDAVLRSLELAHRVGFDQISIDLIYNLPLETEESWSRDLTIIEDTPITGASIYNLIAFSRSSLQRRIENGSHPPLGGLDRQLARCLSASYRLTSRPGWQRLSSAHYGDLSLERSVYNGMRSLCSDMLAIGAGAGGQIGRVSYMHTHDVNEYIREPAGTSGPAPMGFLIPTKVDRLKAIFALSERGIIDRTKFDTLLPDCDLLPEKLAHIGLIKRDKDSLKLTPEGCFWSYNIGAMLAELIRRQLEND